MRYAVAVAVVLLLTSVPEASAEATKLPQVVELIGEVTLAARPVENALVVAFGLSNSQSKHVHTAANGGFRLASLPSGVYRLIAVKQGFAPAVATVIPSANSMRISLRMRHGKPAPEVANQIWEIRRSLPSDVLRELDHVLAPTMNEAYASRRFAGEMQSLTGVSDASSASAAFAQTALAVHTPLPFGWSVDLSGRIGEEQASELAMPESRSSNISMALQTAGSSRVHVASSQKWWQLSQVDDSSAADFRSHSIRWEHSGSEVGVRYISQENLFPTQDKSSEMIELAGRKQLYSSMTNDVGVSVRVWQETPTAGSSEVEYRTADLATTGRWRPMERFAVYYGMQTRVTPRGQSWSPQTGFEISLGERAALVATGSYKVGSEDEQYIGLPSIVSSNDTATLVPRYRYAFGIVSQNNERGEAKAIASVTAIDRPINLVFDEGFLSNNLWESYVLRSGDLHHDLTVACSRALRDFALSASATAATTRTADAEAKQFVTSHVRSLYRPSGTSLELAYRFVDQPEDEQSLLETNRERFNVRVGQALHLPLDLTVLLGIDFTRPSSGESDSTAVMQRRYVGGVSVAF